MHLCRRQRICDLSTKASARSSHRCRRTSHVGPGADPRRFHLTGSNWPPPARPRSAERDPIEPFRFLRNGRLKSNSHRQRIWSFDKLHGTLSSRARDIHFPSQKKPNRQGRLGQRYCRAVLTEIKRSMAVAAACGRIVTGKFPIRACHRGTARPVPGRMLVVAHATPVFTDEGLQPIERSETLPAAGLLTRRALSGQRTPKSPAAEALAQTCAYSGWRGKYPHSAVGIPC
jgi:hypothetical protein